MMMFSILRRDRLHENIHSDTLLIMDTSDAAVVETYKEETRWRMLGLWKKAVAAYHVCGLSLFHDACMWMVRVRI